MELSIDAFEPKQVIVNRDDTRNLRFQGILLARKYDENAEDHHLYQIWKTKNGRYVAQITHLNSGRYSCRTEHAIAGSAAEIAEFVGCSPAAKNALVEAGIDAFEDVE